MVYDEAKYGPKIAWILAGIGLSISIGVMWWLLRR
jgi:hypothetical protein